MTFLNEVTGLTATNYIINENKHNLFQGGNPGPYFHGLLQQCSHQELRSGNTATEFKQGPTEQEIHTFGQAVNKPTV